MIGDWRLAAALAVAVAATSCARPEQSLLERFFGASRLRDLAALQSIATVVFEPRRDGIVRTFEIAGVSQERRNGQIVEKEITVDAPVILPNGQTIQKTLIVTLERTGPEDSSRWLVTAVTDAGASRTAPRS